MSASVASCGRRAVQLHPTRGCEALADLFGVAHVEQALLVSGFVHLQYKATKKQCRRGVKAAQTTNRKLEQITAEPTAKQPKASKEANKTGRERTTDTKTDNNMRTERHRNRKNRDGTMGMGVSKREMDSGNCSLKRIRSGCADSRQCQRAAQQANKQQCQRGRRCPARTHKPRTGAWPAAAAAAVTRAHASASARAPTHARMGCAAAEGRGQQAPSPSFAHCSLFPEHSADH